MNMKKFQKIFVILCAFIMLLSVNYSVNAIDTTTSAPTTSTVTTVSNTPEPTSTPAPTPTSTPTATINPNEKIEIVFRSLWTGNDKPRTRIHLFANDEELDIKTTDPIYGSQRDGIILDYQNGWQYTQTNLPRYDQDGKEIKYSAKQEIIDEDIYALNGLKFKTITTGSSEERYFTFKNISLINIKVGKTWNEIPSIVIPGTPSPANPPTMTAFNFSESEYTAAYDEEELNELVAESDALDADDSVSPEYTTALNDDNSLFEEEQPQASTSQQSSVAMPDSITVNLLADGVVVGTIQVTKEQGWENEFVSYPRYDENDDHEINYTIEEVPVNGYKTDYIHTRVIDMIVNRSVIDIPVAKKWVGKIQSPVQVTLHRKYTTSYYDYEIDRNVTQLHDEEVETVELNEENNWKYTFKEQYEFYVAEGEDSSKYEYYVTEDSIANYATDITGNQDEGFTITNTNTTDLIDIPVEKKWDGDIANSTKVTLFANGDEVETVELNAANNWKYTFTHLQKYNNDGSDVAYAIKEVGEDGNVIELDGKKFDVEYSGDITQGFKVTNKKPLDPPTPTPTPTPTPKPTPKTTDNNHVKLYGLLTLLSTILVVVVASKRIKYSN